MDENTRFLMEWMQDRFKELRDDVRVEMSGLKKEVKANSEFRHKLLGMAVVAGAVGSLILKKIGV